MRTDLPRAARRILPALLLAVALVSCSDDDNGPALASPTDPPATPSTTNGAEPSTTPTDGAPEEQPRIEEYVALGDSFTAAPGVPPVDQASGSCFRSQANYPSLVADQLDAELVDRSCGGADTSHVTEPQRLFDRSVPPQARALTRGTDLVTIGLGGNDENLYGTVLDYCLQVAEQDPDGTPCRTGLAGRGVENPVTALTGRIRERLVEVVEQVRRRSPQAEIVLVGYPRLVPRDDTCPERLPIATGDYAFVRETSRLLTAAVEGAAEDTGATYIDMWSASEGHDICADEPWVRGRQPAGNAQVYHPFPVHQQVVADLVLEQLS